MSNLATAAIACPVQHRPFQPQKGVWVIYDLGVEVRGPRYVARKFFAGRCTVLVAQDDELHGQTLGEVRDLLPGGLINIGRLDDDPRNVVEVWA